MQLAIDTSTEIATIALFSEGTVQAELTWHSQMNQTAELLPNVVHLLKQAKIGLQNIDGIIIAKGPGSFNGLRVGMSTAKGLALALDIPLVGISTLEAEAFQHAYTGRPICPVLNAGRGEIATALYQKQRGQWQRLMEEHITTVEELCSQIKKRTIFCGNISPTVASRLMETLGRRAVILKGATNLRRAGFLAELGWYRLSRGDCDDVATLQPLYLRRPSITLSQKNLLGS
jgi:tRNA threonylcarbamoyladenosine biosynthesis protein TsaB